MNPAPVSRRHFLHAALAGGAVSQTPIIAADTAPKAGMFAEPAHDIPLANDADVIVCGAGPAGVTAAITAARAGARCACSNGAGCLGGIWTAGLLGYFLDFNNPASPKNCATSSTHAARAPTPPAPAASAMIPKRLSFCSKSSAWKPV